MGKLHSFLAVVLLLTLSSSLEILSVSSDPVKLVRPAISSLAGGKEIYIKAIGHSPMAADNRVSLVNSLGA